MSKPHKGYSKKAHVKKVKRRALNALIDDQAILIEDQEDVIDTIAKSLYEKNRRLAFLQLMVKATTEDAFDLKVVNGQVELIFDPMWFIDNYEENWPEINKPVYLKGVNV